MTPIGLDLSVVSTGWCAHGVDVGRIRTDIGPAKTLKGIDRRRYIADQVEAVIAAAVRPRWLRPPVPVLCVIEKSYVGGVTSTQTGIDLAMLHAVVLDLLGPLRCPIAYVAPSTLKKHLAGKGGASKAEMVAAAQAAGYGGHQDDEADAFGLALIGHHLLGGHDHLAPHRSSCLQAVEWLVPLPETAEVAG